MVSLPKQWVDAHNLVKSSQVQIETLENSLSITVGEGRKLSKEIEIEYPLPNEENIAANITGAYLLGYDTIKIKGKSTISVKDREIIRESMRRLVGMEILDEDASNIDGQFLLDETSLNPKKIFKRMSSIALGMFDETLSTLTTGDSTNLQTIPNRDDEINRQYFLLVRFIRSTMVDRRLAGIFNLENIDILDYRIAGNILETAGDTIVDLSKSITDTSLSFTEIVDLPLILIMSYPSRYAPVMLAAMFSSLESGYSISISLDIFLPSSTVIERLFSKVSIWTCELLTRLWSSTHCFGSDTKILLPIFCRRRVNLDNLN